MDARTLSARRLMVLIEGLPGGSRTFGGDGWLVEHELAALLLEMFVAAHTPKRKGGKPFRIPRPGEAAAKSKPQRKPMSVMEQVQFVASKAMDRRR